MAAATPLEQALVSLLAASPAMRPDDLGSHVVHAGELLGGRDVEVLLVDLEQLVLRSITGGGRELPVSGSAAGAAFHSESFATEAASGGGVRLWVPILDSAERVGVVGAVVPDASPETRRQWSVLGGLVGELVVTKTRYGDALAVARRTRAVTLAAELRWNLLPPLTFTSPDIVIAGMLEPAYEVAGDTFDYAVNGDVAHVGLFDAMGHGLEACRMANLAVGSYRNSRRSGADLVATTTAMDAVLLDQFGESRFVTGQLATLALGTGALDVVNAGHPAPTVFHVDGTYEEVPVESSPPIGIDLGARTVSSTALREGDVLLFHTDGITEARGEDGSHFGTDRLRGLVCSLLAEDLRPAEVIRQVVLEVIEHGRPLRDDATLVLVGWRMGNDAVPPAVRVIEGEPPSSAPSGA